MQTVETRFVLDLAHVLVYNAKYLTTVLLQIFRYPTCYCINCVVGKRH
jgi:hypothetical protein